GVPRRARDHRFHRDLPARGRGARAKGTAAKRLRGVDGRAARARPSRRGSEPVEPVSARARRGPAAADRALRRGAGRMSPGNEERLADGAFDDYRAFTRARAAQLESAADMVVTHDALAAGLVEARPQEGVWVWRCHLDVSRPQRRVWTFLRQYVVKYDAALFS